MPCHGFVSSNKNAFVIDNDCSNSLNSVSCCLPLCTACHSFLHLYTFLCRLSMDLNCLRAVECISGTDERSKCLRSEAAYQMLVKFLDKAGYLSLLYALNILQ